MAVAVVKQCQDLQQGARARLRLQGRGRGRRCRREVARRDTGAVHPRRHAVLVLAVGAGLGGAADALQPGAGERGEPFVERGGSVLVSVSWLCVVASACFI